MTLRSAFSGLVFGTSLLFSGAPGNGAVRLPALFSDHMVLQADRPVTVWGWADPDETVSVQVGEIRAETRTTGDGRWRVELPALSATEAMTMEVQGNNKIVLRDVLIGEVWLASGQSNMAGSVSTAKHAAEETAAANHPEIRIFTVATRFSENAEAECQGRWVKCSPETVGAMSAVGYFFGRELNTELKRPVGVIVASLGATAIQSWTSLAAQQSVPALRPVLERKFATSVPGPKDDPAKVDRKNAPGGLFNAMIHPLAPFGVRGVIWYQGENNTRDVEFAALYGTQLKVLVQDWRRLWNSETLPFAWVQLPDFNNKGRPGWPIVREEMRRALALPHTGMAVVMNIGDTRDLHPPGKQIVARRLAEWALHDVYGHDLSPGGPLFLNQSIGSEGKITVLFATKKSGLVMRGDTLRGFEIAGRDRRWHPAQAEIVDEGTAVRVESPGVIDAVAVRYAWGGHPDANLFNTAGQPASPFTSQTWEYQKTDL